MSIQCELVLEFLECLGKRRLLRPRARGDRVVRPETSVDVRLWCTWQRRFGACSHSVTAVGQELIEPIHLWCKWQRLFGDCSCPIANVRAQLIYSLRFGVPMP